MLRNPLFRVACEGVVDALKWRFTAPGMAQCGDFRRGRR